MNLFIFFSASASVPYVDVPGLGVAFGALSSEDSSIAVFNGIRYATAPIGERRWQSPTPAGPFVDALENATEYGPICWQTPPHHGYNGTYTMSEDCLFLNVAGPVAALNGSKALPVAVWIHGGSYVSGSSNLYRNFAMASAAKGELIVVTLNYRLNTIGFLGSPAIASAANGATGSAGNFGIEDQRAAMDWVKAHIAAFGGDAKRVTIFGESAGGNSVLNHLAQPKSKGLFQRAIIESGVYSSGGRTMLDATAQYNATLLAASCDASASAADQIACLRACNASSLVEYSSLPPLGAMWLPVIDGVSMTKAPTDLIAEGAASYNAEVPVVLGSNRDEMAYFYIYEGKADNLTESDFDASLAAAGDASLGEGLKQIYDPDRGGSYVLPRMSARGNFSKWWWISMRVATDFVWGLGPCAHRALARSLVAGGTPSVHAYFFTHPTQTDSTDGGVPGVGPGSVVVPHASEIPYAYSDASQLTPGEEADLATGVGAYWIAFALDTSAGGDPNPRGPGANHSVQWPAYDAKSDKVLRFDVESAGGIRVQSGLRQTACDFMDAHKKPDPPLRP